MKQNEKKNLDPPHIRIDYTASSSAHKKIEKKT
jgi:hypothetical protein